jgi:hypothetical protein
LRLKIRCGACAARSPDCLEIRHPSGRDSLPLGDAEWLLVTLPAYLTLPGADFEAVGTTGSQVDTAVEDVLARHFQALPAAKDLEPCEASLGAWSEPRCREGFGAEACPLGRARARAVCGALPSVEGARDGRVEMLP